MSDDRIRIQIDVPATPVEAPDAELRAAAEALLLGASDTVGDLFVRNLMAVGRPAVERLARACGQDWPPNRLQVGDVPCTCGARDFEGHADDCPRKGS